METSRPFSWSYGFVFSTTWVGAALSIPRRAPGARRILNARSILEKIWLAPVFNCKTGTGLGNVIGVCWDAEITGLPIKE